MILAFPFKRHGQLLICMELMDAPMDKFYQIMHSLQNVTFDELDHVLRRLINNVSLLFFIFLTAR